jgi:hypothetical protein
MNKVILSIILFSACAVGYAQQTHSDVRNVPDDSHIMMTEKDTQSLGMCFSKAHWEAHSRMFSMATLNQSGNHHYAVAAGSGIGVLTKPYKGFQLGMSGFFIFNLLSSDLGKRDSLGNALSRYERQLFDIHDPDNRHDLDRLEELYLKYKYSQSSITVGRMNLRTPMINPQDSRMRPSIEEGIWLSVSEWEKWQFNGGWITGFSPRGTVDWYHAGESIGLLNQGVNTDGSPGNYQGKIHTKGVGLANVNYHFSPSYHLEAWNFFIENVMNTTYLDVQGDQTWRGIKFHEGLMWVHQNALNHGGHENPQWTYVDRDAVSNVLSARLSMEISHWNISMNYTHITDEGRFLMPREWGSEPFYTYMSRERNEGLGGVDAMMCKLSYIGQNKRFLTSFSYGYFDLPDVKNVALNKYGLPSYHQLNAEAVYEVPGFLQGLQLKFLAVYKLASGNTYDQPQYIENNVNVANLNIVADFRI